MASSPPTTLSPAVTAENTMTTTAQVTVLIENPRKSTNWGPLLRCCAAFGISQIFVVGFDTCSVEGSHGASKHVELVAFHNHQTAVEALDQLGFQRIGLVQGAPGASMTSTDSLRMRQWQDARVMEDLLQVAVKEELSNVSFRSLPVHARPFSERTCLVVGKRASGLNLSLANLCQNFVHIPVIGLDADDTTMLESWLTVEAGLSIVLHEFAMWAGYDQEASQYQGQKYEVCRKVKGLDDPAEKKRKRSEREQEPSQEDLQLGTSIFDVGTRQDEGDY